MTSSARRRLILDLMDAMAARGHTVMAAKISPDGCITLLTELPAAELASNQNDDWVMLAGATQISRA